MKKILPLVIGGITFFTVCILLAALFLHFTKQDNTNKTQNRPRKSFTDIPKPVGKNDSSNKIEKIRHDINSNDEYNFNNWGTNIKPSDMQMVTFFKKEVNKEVTEDSILNFLLSNFTNTIHTKQDIDFLSDNNYSTVIKHNNTTDVNTTDVKRIYGNVLATVIQNFDSKHYNNVDILNTFLKNRDSGTAKSKLTSLANEYKKLTPKIKELSTPSGFTSANTRFADSYTLLGDYLLKLTTNTKSDSEFLTAVLDYNRNASSEYAKSFLALSNLFKAHGVKFKKGDSGEIFTARF